MSFKVSREQLENELANKQKSYQHYLQIIDRKKRKFHRSIQHLKAFERNTQPIKSRVICRTSSAELLANTPRTDNDEEGDTISNVLILNKTLIYLEKISKQLLLQQMKELRIFEIKMSENYGSLHCNILCFDENIKQFEKYMYPFLITNGFLSSVKEQSIIFHLMLKKETKHEFQTYLPLILVQKIENASNIAFKLAKMYTNVENDRRKWTVIEEKLNDQNRNEQNFGSIKKHKKTQNTNCFLFETFLEKKITDDRRMLSNEPSAAHSFSPVIKNEDMLDFDTDSIEHKIRKIRKTKTQGMMNIVNKVYHHLLIKWDDIFSGDSVYSQQLNELISVRIKYIKYDWKNKEMEDEHRRLDSKLEILIFFMKYLMHSQMIFDERRAICDVKKQQLSQLYPKFMEDMNNMQFLPSKKANSEAMKELLMLKNCDCQQRQCLANMKKITNEYSNICRQLQYEKQKKMNRNKSDIEIENSNNVEIENPRSKSTKINENIFFAKKQPQKVKKKMRKRGRKKGKKALKKRRRKRSKLKHRKKPKIAKVMTPLEEIQRDLKECRKKMADYNQEYENNERKKVQILHEIREIQCEVEDSEAVNSELQNNVFKCNANVRRLRYSKDIEEELTKNQNLNCIENMKEIDYYSSNVSNKILQKYQNIQRSWIQKFNNEYTHDVKKAHEHRMTKIENASLQIMFDRSQEQQQSSSDTSMEIINEETKSIPSSSYANVQPLVIKYNGQNLESQATPFCPSPNMSSNNSVYAQDIHLPPILPLGYSVARGRTIDQYADDSDEEYEAHKEYECKERSRKPHGRRHRSMNYSLKVLLNDNSMSLRQLREQERNQNNSSSASVDYATLAFDILQFYDQNHMNSYSIDECLYHLKNLCNIFDVEDGENEKYENVDEEDLIIEFPTLDIAVELNACWQNLIKNKKQNPNFLFL